MQRQVPLLSGCPRSLPYAQSRAIRSWTLDIVSMSSCLWRALVLVFTRQSTVAFEEFLCSFLRYDCARAVRTWKSGHHFLVPSFLAGTLFAQCLARQWIDVPHQFPVAFGRISFIFYVKESSDPAVDSCLALRRVIFTFYAKWRSAHSRCFNCLICPSWLHLEIRTLFPRARVSGSHLHRRGGGVAGSFDSQVTCHQLVSETVVASPVWRPYTHVKPCPRQQQQ